MVQTLTVLCEIQVIRVRILELRHFPNDESSSRMIPSVPKLRHSIEATHYKWKNRLENSYSCCVGHMQLGPRFDEHATLFNLALRSVIANMQGPEVEGELPRLTGAFYDSVCRARLPGGFRRELREWHCLNIMAERYFSQFHRHVFPFFREDPSPLVGLLWIWDLERLDYKGLKFRKRGRTTSVAYAGIEYRF